MHFLLSTSIRNKIIYKQDVNAILVVAMTYIHYLFIVSHPLNMRFLIDCTYCALRSAFLTMSQMNVLQEVLLLQVLQREGEGWFYPSDHNMAMMGNGLTGIMDMTP